jgi:hypothetical protein
MNRSLLGYKSYVNLPNLALGAENAHRDYSFLYVDIKEAAYQT